MVAQWLVAGSLLVAGLIHIVPSVGALGVERLHSLYGVELVSREAILLMQHRAVLFGIIGGLLMLSAAQPSLHWLGIAVGLISVVSFLVLAYRVQGLNLEVTRIVMVDWFALALLLLATVAKICFLEPR